jgi:hypothetical protein
MGAVSKNEESTGWQEKCMTRHPHWRARALSRPSTTISAVVIFVGQAGCVKSGRHGNLLCAVRGIGDHPATDRAVEILAPKLAAIGSIKGIEVAALAE